MTAVAAPQPHSSPTELSAARHGAARLPLLALLIVFSLGITGFTIWLKTNALINWRYTSDMFVVDSMLQETLRGHFVVEYTYGRQFGDHALLILLVLIPIKWLLGKHMVWFLILISPLMLLVAGWIMVWIARQLAGIHWALFVGFLWFMTAGVIQGPFEETFGLHIDTIAGFPEVVMAAFLLLRDERGPSRGASIGAIAATCVFCLVKEEMSLLAIIFYGLLLTQKRSRLHVAGLCVSLAIFVGQLIVIKLSRSPWSRTNELLFRQVMEIFQTQGASYLFNAKRWNYWTTILPVMGAMYVLVALCRRINVFAACLFLVGSLKLGFAWFAQDFDPYSWHNYSALTMLNGSIILQALELRHVAIDKPRFAQAIATALVICFAAWFLTVERAGAKEQVRRTEVWKKRTKSLRHPLLDIQSRMDKSKVVSIALNSDIAWVDGWRYTFFPNGITTNLTGYVHYLVIHKNQTHPRLATSGFVRIYQNGSWRLYQRKKFLPGELESRQAFIDYYGADSIGADEKNERKRKQKKRPATTQAGITR
jgi:hypothetical protein